MLETVVVGALLLAAIAVSAVAWSYRRFAGVRARLVEYLGQAAPEMTVRALTEVGFVAVALGSEVDVDLATLARRRPRGMSERLGEPRDLLLQGDPALVRRLHSEGDHVICYFVNRRRTNSGSMVSMQGPFERYGAAVSRACNSADGSPVTARPSAA